MRYTIRDIKNIASFTDSLKLTCDDIRNGMPKSRACEKNGVSLSMFNSIMHGLRRTCANSPEPLASLQKQTDILTPVWQDRLIYDLGCSDDTYIPDDFEEMLDTISGTFLTPEESTVISSYYKEHKTIAMISKEQNISPSTVSLRRQKGLRKLKKHRDELLHGMRYAKDLEVLNDQCERHEKEISWLNDAINYLKNFSKTDSGNITGESKISEAARDFYTELGFKSVADVMSVPVTEIIERISEIDNIHGSSINAESTSSDHQDTPLSDLNLSQKAVGALKYKGITTVGEAVELSLGDILSIPHVSEKQVLKIYRFALAGAKD